MSSLSLWLFFSSFLISTLCVRDLKSILYVFGLVFGFGSLYFFISKSYLYLLWSKLIYKKTCLLQHYIHISSLIPSVISIASLSFVIVVNDLKVFDLHTSAFKSLEWEFQLLLIYNLFLGADSVCSQESNQANFCFV